MGRKIIIALGGNALIKENQTGTIYEQFANTRKISSSIVTMIQDGWTPVITHGNGPQVGAILLQNNATRDTIPPMPLGVCVAESQGLIGYMIQQCLRNAMDQKGLTSHIATIITQVLVDKNDPSFSNPTKPIGLYYSEEEIEKLKEDGYQVTKQIKGYRIVVPSPDPLEIIEGPVIKQMLDQNITVIAAGGGGMPVVRKEQWGLDGVEAVVDKDLASEKLAEAIQAETMLILTNVKHVYLGYNTEHQQKLTKVSLDEIKKHYSNNEFLPGNMGPKILAAIRFLEWGGRNVIISDLDSAHEALQGTTGTHIKRL